MIVSRPNSRAIAVSRERRGPQKVLVSMLMGISVAVLVSTKLFAWQEEQDATEQTQAEQSQEQEATKEKAKEHFFLGARPELKRQVGPALGKPRSILPQPYLPKGTIEIPPPPQAAETAAGQADQTVTDLLEGQDLAARSQDEMGVETETLTTTEETLAIQERALETLDPSGVAILRNGQGYGARFWDGLGRQEIEQQLGSFARPSKMKAMNHVARKVALSGFVLPAPSDDQDVDRFVRARLQALAAHGDMEGYLALLDALSPEHDWSGLAREIAEGKLLAGHIEDACAIAAEERSDSNDAYWLRLATFCRAVQGDRVGVDFSLGILEEVSPVQPTFYQLTDQILVEAEQSSGAVLSTGMVLTNTLKVDVLEATMARLAKVQVPLLDQEVIDPLAAKNMLEIPGVAPAAKLQLISRGLTEGWLDAGLLLAYLRQLDAAPSQDMDLAALIAADQSFDADVMLMGAAMHAADEIQRTEALDSLKVRATDPAKATYMLPALDLIIGDAEGPAASTAREFRLALLNQDAVAANRMAIALRASSAGSDVGLDAVLKDSWPLMAVAGLVSAPEVTPGALSLWWQQQVDDDTRFAKASLLFTVLEALGHTVPEDVWVWAEAGSPIADGPSMSPALWRRLLVMKAQGDRAGVLSLAYRMTASGTVSASFAGSLIGTLRELGFKDEAHVLAAEMLVRRGL